MPRAEYALIFPDAEDARPLGRESEKDHAAIVGVRHVRSSVLSSDGDGMDEIITRFLQAQFVVMMIIALLRRAP